MNKPVVLITGALTGIGRATAFAFAHEGAWVVVSGRHDDEGHKLATELRNLGAEAEFVPAVAQIRGYVAFYPDRVDEIAERLSTTRESLKSNRSNKRTLL